MKYTTVEIKTLGVDIKMVVVYESKTGFTKRYADMLASKTGMKFYSVKEFLEQKKNDEIIFLGWMKAGQIQGLKKLKNHNVKAVCTSGTAKTAEPDLETVISRNNIHGKPFFYLRGGCLPLKDLKGFDKILMSMFVKMLKKSTDKDYSETISNIENGFNGVKEENLTPIFKWLKII